MHRCVHYRCCRIKIKVRNFKITWCSAIFNKQECIAIMLLHLNHGHSEHKQKADMHGYSYQSMAIFMTSSGTMSRCSDHSFAIRYCNKPPHMVLLLNSVASHDLASPWAGFLQGDHLRQSEPSKATIVGPGGPSTATQFAVDGSGRPVVVGDHLLHDKPKHRMVNRRPCCTSARKYTQDGTT